jgi:hypothetical protein
LNELRHRYPVLQTGDRRVVCLNLADGTYAYLRSDTTAMVLIAVNTSKVPQSISIPNLGFKHAMDYLNGNRVELKDEVLDIHLPPQSGAFICQ